MLEVEDWASEQREPSMKVPPKRKGNIDSAVMVPVILEPSMKVPPKRKGNKDPTHALVSGIISLNESPSEKEGKSWV